MVRTVIPFRPRPRDADAFVADAAREEGGAPAAPDPGTAEIEAVWDALGGLDAEDFDLDRREARPDAASRRTVLVAGGALAASIALGAAFLWTQRPTVYESAIGERRTVVLADGSSVTLNTDTRLQARIAGDRREVRLESGEAYFVVAHRPDDAPFDVLSHDTRIRVVGTRFNVRRRPAATDVDLIEGGVEVGPVAGDGAARLTLRPGQAVRVSAEGQAGPVAPAHAERIADWRQGRISFAQTPLSDALAEMNRYSRARLRLADPALGDMRVDGVFEAGDTAAFARALHALHGVAIRQDGDGWILSAPS